MLQIFFQHARHLQICSYYKRQFHFLLPRPCPEEMAGGRGLKIFLGGFHGSRNRLSEQFFEIRPLSQDMGTPGGPLQGQKMVKNFFSIFLNFLLNLLCLRSLLHSKTIFMIYFRFQALKKRF